MYERTRPNVRMEGISKTIDKSLLPLVETQRNTAWYPFRICGVGVLVAVFDGIPNSKQQQSNQVASFHCCSIEALLS